MTRKAKSRKNGQPVHGWVNLDKPVGVSSAKAVAIVRRVFNAAKAGHGGTLDPLASGVLPIALGEATKMVAFAMGSHKSYEFTLAWGVETSTDDAVDDFASVARACCVGLDHGESAVGRHGEKIDFLSFGVQKYIACLGSRPGEAKSRIIFVA